MDQKIWRKNMFQTDEITRKAFGVGGLFYPKKKWVMLKIFVLKMIISLYLLLIFWSFKRHFPVRMYLVSSTSKMSPFEFRVFCILRLDQKRRQNIENRSSVQIVPSAKRQSKILNHTRTGYGNNFLPHPYMKPSYRSLDNCKTKI